MAASSIEPRTLLRWAGLKSAASPSRIRPHREEIPSTVVALTRMYSYTDNSAYNDWAKRTLDVFAGVAPQYGMFAATYGLAATLFADHPTQVVITGPDGDEGALRLEQAAHSVFRFGKAVLRVTPETPLDYLPAALKLTLRHLPREKPAALVCSGNTCLPPIGDAEMLQRLLRGSPAGMSAK